MIRLTKRKRSAIELSQAGIISRIHIIEWFVSMCLTPYQLNFLSVDYFKLRDNLQYI